MMCLWIAVYDVPRLTSLYSAVCMFMLQLNWWPVDKTACQCTRTVVPTFLYPRITFPTVYKLWTTSLYVTSQCHKSLIAFIQQMNRAMDHMIMHCRPQVGNHCTRGQQWMLLYMRILFLWDDTALLDNLISSVLKKCCAFIFGSLSPWRWRQCIPLKCQEWIIHWHGVCQKKGHPEPHHCDNL